MVDVKFGISPLTWTNDDMPSLGGEIPLETCLAEMQEAGFVGTELGTKYPRDPAIIIPLLAKYGLSIASGWFSGNLFNKEKTVKQEIADFQSHLELLSKAGCRATVYGEVSNTVHGSMDVPLSKRYIVKNDDEWKWYGERLTQFSEYAKSQGLDVGYHHHMGTVVQSVQDIDKLMQYSGDALGLTLDTGHVTFAGGDPVPVIEKHAKRIVHVHFKDVRPEILKKVHDEDLSFLQAVLEGIYTVPGDGCIDYPSVFKSLKKIGYKGWLLVEAEQDPKKAHPLTYAKLAMKNLRSYADLVGYTY
ncbi:MAG: myo-inosose-2 dehydratase [Alphaproteobacteria bacterium]